MELGERSGKKSAEGSFTLLRDDVARLNNGRGHTTDRLTVCTIPRPGIADHDGLDPSTLVQFSSEINVWVAGRGVKLSLRTYSMQSAASAQKRFRQPRISQETAHSVDNWSVKPYFIGCQRTNGQRTTH